MGDNRRVDFERIKAEADFATVLRHYGFEVPAGRIQLKIRCPFHDDERPSCSVNLDKRLFHCHAGGCGASGNVLDFVWRMENRNGEAVSLRVAGRTLAGICGIPLDNGPGRPQEARTAARGGKTGKTPSQRPNRVSGAPSAATAPVSKPERNRPLGFTLTLDPEHPYVRERVGVPEMAALFGVGFCARGSMAGRVCIGIHNEHGELVAYLGRWALSDEVMPEGEEKYKLPAGFEKRHALFNLHRVRHCRRLTLVEGPFAAIRLHSLRIPAVALLGSSLAEEQVTLLSAACPALRFVTVLLDGDPAGRTATETVAARLSRHYWVRTVALPDDAQPDTLTEAELLALLGRSRES